MDQWWKNRLTASPAYRFNVWAHSDVHSKDGIHEAPGRSPNTPKTNTLGKTRSPRANSCWNWFTQDLNSCHHNDSVFTSFAKLCVFLSAVGDLLLPQCDEYNGRWVPSRPHITGMANQVDRTEPEALTRHQAGSYFIYSTQCNNMGHPRKR